MVIREYENYLLCLVIEFGRGGEFPSCMSVTSSELDSTSDYNHRLHYEQQHSLKEAGNPPGRGNFIAVPSAFSNSPIIEERSQPPANKDLLGIGMLAALLL